MSFVASDSFSLLKCVGFRSDLLAAISADWNRANNSLGCSGNVVI